MLTLVLAQSPQTQLLYHIVPSVNVTDLVDGPPYLNDVLIYIQYWALTNRLIFIFH